MKVAALLFTILAVATGFATPPSDDPTVPGRTTYSGGLFTNPGTVVRHNPFTDALLTNTGNSNLFGNALLTGNTNTGGGGCAGQACTSDKQCSCGHCLVLGASGTCVSEAL